MNKVASVAQQPKYIIWLEWGALIAIIIVASYLRFWRIEEVPPGFNSDEAVGAMGALTTLRHGFQYSYEGQGGGGALGFYFAAAFFYLFGPSVATLRGLTAWAGVMSIFANYWAMREMFRQEGLSRARWIALLSTVALALSRWHFSSSRVAFAGIGVPFLMMPSVYFLWLGLNWAQAGRGKRWPFVVSGIFLGALMYIYLSGVMAPPLYAAFFLGQWALIKLLLRFKQTPIPKAPYLTDQFWNLFITALTATILLVPMLYVLLTRPELEPGTSRASQAFFMNPQINQGDPWGLLWRSITGNFGAYGLSLSWLWGQTPRLVVPFYIGLFTFTGFLIAFWRALRGQTVYLFIVLWLPLFLLPSILSPDVIPHQLRTLGASPAVYACVAITIVWLFEMGRLLVRRLWPAAEQTGPWLATGWGVVLTAVIIYLFLPGYRDSFNYYFNIFPYTNDAQAAYHVYAGKMADVINRETRPNVAFILPRNTAAGDVFRNFATDFLVELEQPPATHYWVVDDERTLPADLTTAAADHDIIRVVHWKTSKHTGADPKEIIPYYLEKYGHFERTDSFEYFDIDTYRLETPAPNFAAAETLQPVSADFGRQIQLTGYALGNANNVAQLTDPQANSNGLLWLRLAWRKTADHPQNLKVSAVLYNSTGQLVTQMDKLLINNILQVPSAQWDVGDTAETYFLMPIPPATPPGTYRLELAVYGAESLARLPVNGGATRYPLTNITITPPASPVSADDIPLALGVNRELVPGITLLGFESLPAPTVRAGDRFNITLLWQAGQLPPAQDWQMALQAKAGEGQAEWSISEPVGLAGPGYPTSQWQAGDVWRGWLAARIPPSLEPGRYELELHITTTTEPVVLPVGEFDVTGWPRTFEPPQPQVELGADFNGQATLTGLDVAAQTIAPGDTLPVRLYWQAGAEFAVDYTAFVHLIGPDGLLYGQVDQTPGAGAFPTTGWLPGEYLHDDYTITVASNAPPGNYQLEIGMYNPATGERLPVTPPDCRTDGCQYSDNRVLWPGPTVE